MRTSESCRILVREKGSVKRNLVRGNRPHHGSPTSSSPALVAATRPQWAVMSLGRANRFGFPSAEVVERWRAVGATVIRTDRLGAITATVGRGGQLAVTSFDPANETAGGSQVIMPR